MSDLIALADEIERASGPDRDLDLSIHRHIDPEHVAFMNDDLAKGTAELIALGGEAWEKRKDALFSSCNRAPRYTASLDAAMTLVPEGLSFEVRRSGTGDRGQATIWDPMRRPGDKEWRVTGAATPALALVAASLRALAQTSGEIEP